MTTNTLPTDDYQLGIPIAEYPFDYKNLAVNMGCLLLFGLPFLAGGIYWLVTSDGEPQYFLIIPGIGLILFGVVAALRIQRQGRYANPLKGSPTAILAAGVGAGIIVILGSLNMAILMTLGGLLMLGIVAFVMLDRLRVGRIKAIRYVDGFSYQRGSEHLIFRWDDIDSVWIYMNRYGGNLAVKSKSDGMELTIEPRLRESGDLMQAILDEVVQRQLKLAIENLERGQTVEFGPVQVSRMGLKSEKRTASWDQIDEFGFDKNGSLEVIHDGTTVKWPEVKSNAIPNLPVLFQLVADSIEQYKEGPHNVPS